MRPGDDLVVLVGDNGLIVRRIPKLEDIWGKKSLAIVDVDEIESISEKEQEKYLV